MLQQIELHGRLKERYGEIPALDVRDPGEAMRALNAQLPGFGNVIRNGEWYVVLEGEDGKFAIDPSAISMGLAGRKMHIIPAVEGHAGGGGGKGGVKMILGVALIGASLFVPGMQGFGLGAAKAAWATKIAGTGLTYGHMALAGVALAFGGAALMIAPQPSMPSADEKPDTNSFIFNGDQSPSGQNMAVPCVWGRWRAVPIPVATRIDTNQMMIGSGMGGPVVGGGAQTGNAYTNYPPGYDPNNTNGLTPEQYAVLKLINPWALNELHQTP